MWLNSVKKIFFQKKKIFLLKMILGLRIIFENFFGTLTFYGLKNTPPMGGAKIFFFDFSSENSPISVLALLLALVTMETLGLTKKTKKNFGTLTFYGLKNTPP